MESGASAWQPGTVAGSGAVSSVFGRTGAVTAQTGDYNFGQISGALGLQPVSRGGRRFERKSDGRHGDRHPKPGGVEHGSSQRPGAGMEFERFGLATWHRIGQRRGNQCLRQNRHRHGGRPETTDFGQISGTLASSQLPGAGGDLGGTLTAATVKAIQGQPVSSTLPSNGQALVWSSSAGAWQAANVSGSGGGGPWRTNSEIWPPCAPPPPC
jgi:trimeric autotransporter adhesin